MRSIAIIGSGPTAIYTLKYLLEEETPLSIMLFEAQADAGKGTPYHPSWNGKEMLANIASIEIPPVTESFVQWLAGKTDEELAEMNVEREEVSKRAFLPRITLGAYLQAQLGKLMLLRRRPWSSDRDSQRPSCAGCRSDRQCGYAHGP